MTQTDRASMELGNAVRAGWRRAHDGRRGSDRGAAQRAREVGATFKLLNLRTAAWPGPYEGLKERNTHLTWRNFENNRVRTGGYTHSHGHNTHTHTHTHTCTHPSRAHSKKH